jgi:hypothetical protein
MKIVNKGIFYFVQAWGFDNVESLLNQTLFIKNKIYAVTLLMISVSVSVWIDTYIFSPALTYFVFISLSFAESFTGTIKAIRVEKEKFDLDKSLKFIPKLLAHTFALSASWYLAKSDSLLAWMPSTIFIYFSVNNFLKSCLHLIDLKWLEGEFASFLKSKITEHNVFSITNEDAKDK